MQRIHASSSYRESLAVTTRMYFAPDVDIINIMGAAPPLSPRAVAAAKVRRRTSATTCQCVHACMQDWMGARRMDGWVGW